MLPISHLNKLGTISMHQQFVSATLVDTLFHSGGLKAQNIHINKHMENDAFTVQT